MSIEDTPDTPPLTRRQLRELRNTGATPVITENEPVAPPVAPPARAAEPVEIAPAPEIDVDAVPLTRRQARLIERVRTASVPVITAEVAAAEAERRAAEEAERQAAEAGTDQADAEVADAERSGAEDAHDHSAAVDEGAVDENGGAQVFEDDQVDSDAPAETDLRSGVANLWGSPVAAVDDAATDDGLEFAPYPVEGDHDEPDDGQSDRPIVAEDFGVELPVSEGVEVGLPAAFDELLARDSTMTGSASAPSALILSRSPDTSTFDSPIAATGEVLITGTLAFPESFGSTGVVPGSADGEEVDAFLVDREIPAASSPTPIAASSAVSTLKSADEIIQPPTPEKGNRLMMVLAITAGALALALVGVLILGLVSGIFG